MFSKKVDVSISSFHTLVVAVAVLTLKGDLQDSGNLDDTQFQKCIQVCDQSKARISYHIDWIFLDFCKLYLVIIYNRLLKYIGKYNTPRNQQYGFKNRPFHFISIH